jgi:hypothetical protein
MLSNKTVLSSTTATAIQSRAATYHAANVPALGVSATYFTKGDASKTLVAGGLVALGEFILTDTQLADAKAREQAGPGGSIYDLRDGSRWDWSGGSWVKVTGNRLLADVGPGRFVYCSNGVLGYTQTGNTIVIHAGS